MNDTNNESVSKLTYTPPRLREIELVAEEVLSVGCKMANSGMPNAQFTVSCGIMNNCAGEGS